MIELVAILATILGLIYLGVAIMKRLDALLTIHIWGSDLTERDFINPVGTYSSMAVRKVLDAREELKHCWSWPLHMAVGNNRNVQRIDRMIEARDREVANRAYREAMAYLERNPSPVRRND